MGSTRYWGTEVKRVRVLLPKNEWPELFSSVSPLSIIFGDYPLQARLFACSIEATGHLREGAPVRQLPVPRTGGANDLGVRLDPPLEVLPLPEANLLQRHAP